MSAQRSILFLIPSLATRGAERALVNLANHLDKQKYQITVQTLFDVGELRQVLAPEIEYRGGLPFVVRGNVFFLKLFSPAFLYRTIVGRRYDVVVAYLEGTVTRIISGCPYSDSRKIAWVHTSFTTAHDFSYCYQNLTEAISSYVAYDRIVCVSETVRKSIAGWVDGPMTIIHNFVDASQIQTLAKEDLEIAFPNTTPNLLFVGSLEQNKGIDRLLAVHHRLLQDGHPHHLFVIGDGSLAGRLKKQEQSSPTVHILGLQQNPYKYMQQADLYVCASYREGLSYTIIEAMLLGKPVVSTACGGPQELLGENSEYGLLTPNSEQGLYDGILKMLSNPTLMQHYSTRSAERARQFSQSNVIAQHDKLFEE